MERTNPAELTKHAAAVAEALSVSDSTPWAVDQAQAVKAEAEGWETRYVEAAPGSALHRLRICLDYRSGWNAAADKLAVRLVWPHDEQGTIHAPHHSNCTSQINLARAKSFPIMAQEIRRRLLKTETSAAWARCCDEADSASAYVAQQDATIARLVKETGGRAGSQGGTLYHTTPLLRSVEVQGGQVVIKTSSLPADLGVQLIRMIQEFERIHGTDED